MAAIAAPSSAAGRHGAARVAARAARDDAAKTARATVNIALPCLGRPSNAALCAGAKRDAERSPPEVRGFAQLACVMFFRARTNRSRCELKACADKAQPVPQRALQ